MFWTRITVEPFPKSTTIDYARKIPEQDMLIYLSRTSSQHNIQIASSQPQNYLDKQNEVSL